MDVLAFQRAVERQNRNKSATVEQEEWFKSLTFECGGRLRHLIFKLISML